MSDAYDTVELKPSWLGCSLVSIGLLVLYSVSLPFLLGTFRIREYLYYALLLIPGLSLIGTVSGILAVRRSSSRTLAGLSLIVNGTVFGSCVAVVVMAILR